MIEALDIHVQGVVQGVGFRPFVYRTAKKYLINGWVLNATDGVYIHAEGESKLLDEFVLELSDNAPASAHVTQIELSEVPLQDCKTFKIRFSEEEQNKPTTLVSPDLATCDDCVHELFDPSDRRFRYPFINCTNCGPRFTIISELPYDRENTSMSAFTMCEKCAAEYHDPLDRRFHAQPNACFDCGPHVSWYEPNVVDQDDPNSSGRHDSEEEQLRSAGFGNVSSEVEDMASENVSRETFCVAHECSNVKYANTREESDAIFARAVELLLAGKIVAVKGLGGFHLVCDAHNAQAVAKLRSRKRREGKAFAVMMTDVQDVRSVCLVNDVEASVLKAVQRPIVLLRKRADVALAEGIADGLSELGVMLPYTPVQHILMHDFAEEFLTDRKTPPMLVMTSGNIHDEPIVTNDSDAYVSLRDIADGFLGNDRAILCRFDDSVVRVICAGKTGYAVQIIRRARGYAPQPLDVSGVLLSFADMSVMNAPHEKCGNDLDSQNVSRETFPNATKSNTFDSDATNLNTSNLTALTTLESDSINSDAPESKSSELSASNLEAFGEDLSGSEVIGKDTDDPRKQNVSRETFSSALFATGSEQKNTFTLLRGTQAFVSQHIGDMENAETYDAWIKTKQHYEKLFRAVPRLIACDMHPEYFTSKWAHEQGLDVIEVQHHHAHIVSVMAECGLREAVCGIAFDGTGYGVDGTIWGGEILLSNLQAFERFANFTYIPMPGGAAAIKHPLRMAYGVLWAYDLLDHLGAQRALLELGGQADVCEAMIEQDINTPMTSSVGRLFDAASALLGVCTQPTYEGEGAILLEACMNDAQNLSRIDIDSDEKNDSLEQKLEQNVSRETFPHASNQNTFESDVAKPSASNSNATKLNASNFIASGEVEYGEGASGSDVDGSGSSGIAADGGNAYEQETEESDVGERYVIAITKNVATQTSTAQDTSVVLLDAQPVFHALLDDYAQGVPVAEISRRFHDAFVNAIVSAAELVRTLYGIEVVALSGGVFMNRYLIEHVLSALEENGFTVAINKDLPPNDGGISFGQAVIALQRLNDREEIKHD